MMIAADEIPLDHWGRRKPRHESGCRYSRRWKDEPHRNPVN
jgi:hypothetical protein